MELYEINSPYRSDALLNARFLVEKEREKNRNQKFVDIKFCFHATSTFDAAKSIAEEGFREAYATRGLCGTGNYFAVHPRYSANNCFAKRDSNYENRRFMFVCRALVGAGEVSTGSTITMTDHTKIHRHDHADAGYEPAMIIHGASPGCVDPLYLLVFKYESD